MNARDLAACSFGAWCNDFRDSMFRFRVLPLDGRFVEYLLADGVMLPDADQVVRQEDWDLSVYFNIFNSRLSLLLLSIQLELTLTHMLTRTNTSPGQQTQMMPESKKGLRYAYLCPH